MVSRAQGVVATTVSRRRPMLLVRLRRRRRVMMVVVAVVAVVEMVMLVVVGLASRPAAPAWVDLVVVLQVVRRRRRVEVVGGRSHPRCCREREDGMDGWWSDMDVARREGRNGRKELFVTRSLGRSVTRPLFRASEWRHNLAAEMAAATSLRSAGEAVSSQ